MNLHRILVALLALFVVACGDDSEPDVCTGSAALCRAADGGLDASLADSSTGDSSTADSSTSDATSSVAVKTVFGSVVAHEWLNENLDKVVMLDVRAAAEFGAGHLPGAVNFAQGNLRTTVNGVGGQVVDKATAEGVFAAAGVDSNKPVVVYDSSISTSAARVVWTLQYYGHKEAYLLDGGLAGWTHSTETEASVITPTTLALEADEALIVDAEWISERLDGSINIVDARGAGEFNNGHIPGALNVDWSSQLGSTGRFQGVAELNAFYTSLDKSKKTVVYCASGSRASVSFVVLAGLGFDVALYDGSWNEWGSSDYPKEMSN